METVDFTTTHESSITKLDVASWGGFTVFSVSAVIVGICLPEISRTFSTSLSEGGGMETVRNLLVFAVLLAAGMLAQRWGKKRFLTLGQYIIAVGLLLGSMAQNYATLVIALMLLGIGGGFCEALLNPLVVDIHKQQAGKFLNISHAFYPIGIVGAALIFGELLSQGFSWRVIFQIAAVGALIVAVMFSIMRFPPSEKDDSSYPKLFASILSKGGFWLFAAALFLGGSIESALTFWSRSYVDTYLSDVPRAGAFAVVVFAAAMAVGRFLSAYLTNKTSLNYILMGSAILGIVVSGLIPLTNSLGWFYSLLALAGLATASLWPTLMAEADACLPVNTTILFVLLSCVGIVGFGFTPWIMGIIGDNAELRSGFAIIPLLFVGLLVILVIEKRRYPSR